MAKNKVKPTDEQLAEAEAAYPEWQAVAHQLGDQALMDEVETLIMCRKAAKESEASAEAEAKEYGARLHEILTDPAHPLLKFGYNQYLVRVAEGTTVTTIDADVLATTLVEFGVDADTVAAAIAVSKKGGQKYEYVDIRKRKGPFAGAANVD